MAFTVTGDVTIKNDFFRGGQAEVTAQNLGVFNEASGGAIRLGSERHQGYYSTDFFVPLLSGVSGRRDVTSTASQTDNNISDTDIVRVKLFRKFEPTAISLTVMKNLFEQADGSEEQFSQMLGRMYQDKKLADMANLALIAVEAALEDADATYDATGQSTTTLTAPHLNSGLKKLGDRSSSVVTWVMHSTPHHDLVGQGLADKVDSIYGMTVMDGATGYLGRRAVMTDASALTDANGSLTDTYNTLGLVPGAVVVDESEQEHVAIELVTGAENLYYRFQAEYACTVGVKGFTWDTDNGGSNPTDANLGTASNWDQVATSIKDGPGCRIVTE